MGLALYSRMSFPAKSYKFVVLALSSQVLLGACSDAYISDPIPPVHYQEGAKIQSAEVELQRIDRVQKVIFEEKWRCENTQDINPVEVYQLSQELGKAYDGYLATQSSLAKKLAQGPDLSDGKIPKAIPVFESPYKNLTENILYTPGDREVIAMEKYQALQRHSHYEAPAKATIAGEGFSSFEVSWIKAYAGLKEIERKTRTQFGFDFTQKDVAKNLNVYRNWVKRLIQWDTFRIIHDWNYYTDQKTLAHLNRMQRILNKYKGNKTFNELWETTSDESEEFKIFWLNVPFFKKRLKQSGENLITEKADFNKFIGKVDDWRSFHYGNPRNNLKFRSPHSLVLYMDAGEFEGAENLLKKWVVGEWNFSKALNIDIEWVEKSKFNIRNYVPMKMLYHDDFSYTPNVIWNDNLLNLPAGFRVSTYLHEMGHALGLPDEYYDVWREEECTYSVVSNSQDLMSSSSTGWVNEAHIQRIIDLHRKQ